MTKVFTALSVACALMAPLCGCGGGSSNAGQIVAGSVLTEKGAVQEIRNAPFLVGGTSYVIRGDSGRFYMGDFPPEFKQDGLRVFFTVKVTNPQIPADGVGIPVTFTQVSRL